MKLVNKKAKIKVDEYDRSELSPLFIEFLEDNRDRIFTIGQEPKYKGTDLYILQEDPRWIFHIRYLEVIKYAGEM